VIEEARDDPKLVQPGEFVNALLTLINSANGERAEEPSGIKNTKTGKESI
jgi:hypothetical protein